MQQLKFILLYKVDFSYMRKTNVKLLFISLANITNNCKPYLDLPIWSVPHRLDEEILLCDLLTNHEATNARNSSANSIKESKEREKLDYYDETVLVKKPTHYRTDYQIDVEEDDNCFSNSGETADPDD